MRAPDVVFVATPALLKHALPLGILGIYRVHSVLVQDTDVGPLCWDDVRGTDAAPLQRTGRVADRQEEGTQESR
jgi:hypothetical protein